jgi:hypothetical protein
VSAPEWNDDFEDLVVAFERAAVAFVIVGAHALAVEGLPRATGDLDLLVRASRETAQRVFAALVAFRAPVHAHGITVEDFCEEGVVYQIGLPPRRIDIMTSISGVDFDTAWATRVMAGSSGARPFLGREALIANKRAAGRPKDLADVLLLEAARDRDRAG